MFSVKRLEETIKFLDEHGSVDVGELSRQFQVTPKTVRQDLRKLEDMGLLERYHGGAMMKQAGNDIFPIQVRKQKHLPEKERIAALAFRYIEENDIIILDGGSNILQLAKRLGDKKVVVITNDLLIALELLYKENVTLYLAGGKLRREGAFTLLGRDAKKSIERYRANKVFLGTSALDFQQGLMVLSEDEAEIKKAMIAVSKDVICLVDYSKFHKLGIVSFAGLKDINVLITDSRITPEDQNYLRGQQLTLEITR